MLGLRRGNAFRHIVPHHARPPRTDGRTVGPADPKATLPEEWEAPVLTTVATTGEGVAALVTALDRHHAYLQARGALLRRRRQRLAERTRAVVNRAVRHWIWEDTRAEDLLAQRLDEVAAGNRSPYDVAAEILNRLKAGGGTTP